MWKLLWRSVSASQGQRNFTVILKMTHAFSTTAIKGLGGLKCPLAFGFIPATNDLENAKLLPDVGIGVIRVFSHCSLLFNAWICLLCHDNSQLFWHSQGANASALEKEIGSEQFPVNEHYFGLVNVSKMSFCFSFTFPSDSYVLFISPYVVFISFQFGNTCYCNSVLQALYFCRPFREKILAYRSQPRRKENLLTCLADLFHSIANQKRKVGVIPPKKFITRLRKENGETWIFFLSFL